MKALLAFLPVLTLLLGCSPDARNLAQFSEEYAALHEAKDIDGLLGLIVENGYDSQSVRWALREETQWPLASLSFEPIPKEESARLAAALPSAPRWRFFVTLDTADRLTSEWLVGETPDGLRILLPANPHPEVANP